MLKTHNEDVRDTNTSPLLSEVNYAPAESSGLCRNDIRLLALSVSTVARLPDGNAFVAILGTGNERNNLEAVETLLCRESKRLECIPAQDRIEKAIDILQRRVSDVESFL